MRPGDFRTFGGKHEESPNLHRIWWKNTENMLNMVEEGIPIFDSNTSFSAL